VTPVVNDLVTFAEESSRMNAASRPVTGTRASPSANCTCRLAADRRLTGGWGADLPRPGDHDERHSARNDRGAG